MFVQAFERMVNVCVQVCESRPGKGRRLESNAGIRTEEKVKMFLRNQQHQPIEVSQNF